MKKWHGGHTTRWKRWYERLCGRVGFTTFARIFTGFFLFVSLCLLVLFLGCWFCSAFLVGGKTPASNSRLTLFCFRIPRELTDHAPCSLGNAGKKKIADNRTWWIPSSTSGSLTGYIGSKLTSSRILFEPSGSKAALNKHLSLWMTFELWQLYRIYKWNSCLTQLHLPGRGWTNLSPLFNNWDDAGLPLLPARSWDIFLLAGIAMSSWRGTKRSEDFIFLKA